MASPYDDVSQSLEEYLIELSKTNAEEADYLARDAGYDNGIQDLVDYSSSEWASVPTHAERRQAKIAKREKRASNFQKDEIELLRQQQEWYSEKALSSKDAAKFTAPRRRRADSSGECAFNQSLGDGFRVLSFSPAAAGYEVTSPGGTTVWDNSPHSGPSHVVIRDSRGMPHCLQIVPPSSVVSRLKGSGCRESTLLYKEERLRTEGSKQELHQVTIGQSRRITCITVQKVQQDFMRTPINMIRAIFLQLPQPWFLAQKV